MAAWIDTQIKNAEQLFKELKAKKVKRQAKDPCRKILVGKVPS